MNQDTMHLLPIAAGLLLCFGLPCAIMFYAWRTAQPDPNDEYANWDTPTSDAIKDKLRPIRGGTKAANREWKAQRNAQRGKR